MRDETIINRINRFFQKNHMNIESMEGFGDSVDVTIEITGEREYITVGNWKNYYTYTIYLKPEDENSKRILNYILGNEHEIEVKTYDRSSWINGLDRKIEKYMSNIFDYFGVDSNLMLTKIVYVKDNENINESILTEDIYDSITRTIVKDIIKIFKENKIGEFTLPEDLGNPEKMTYNIKNISPFSVRLEIISDKDIYGFELDGNYVIDDDTIEIQIVYNPTVSYTLIKDLTGELNEIVRHELEHAKQHISGYKRKRESKNPLQYFKRKGEFEAQIAGFKARAKQEKKSPKEIAKNWFDKYQNRHNLSQRQIKNLINKLFPDSV